MKRNIPSTPTLRPYQYQQRIRTKPGDVESIQKMLANLPEKRARRAINFDEIKTRSQATIHSVSKFYFFIFSFCLRVNVLGFT